MMKTQIGAVVLGAVGILTGSAGLLAFATAQAPVEKKPAGEAAGGVRLRVNVTEKAKEQKGMIFYLGVKEAGLFFSAEGDKVYVQRGGASFGGGFGGPGGAGLLGGAGGPAGEFPRASLTVWDLAAQKKVEEIARCDVSAPAPGGTSIAMLGAFKNNKHSVRLVDTKNGKVTQEIDLNLPNPFGGAGGGSLRLMFQGSLAFTPNGKRLAIQGPFGTAVWDLSTGKTTQTSLNAPMPRLLGFLADGTSLAALSFPGAFGFGGLGAFGGNAPGGVPQGGAKEEGNIAVWNLATGKLVRRFGDKAASRGALSPGRDLIATYGSGVFGLGGFAGGLGPPGLAAGVAIPGAPPASGNESAKIQLWDVAYGKNTRTLDTQVVPENIRMQINNANGNGFFMNAGGINDVAFSPDGRLLASALGTAEVGYVQVFDTRSGKELHKEKLTFCPQAIAFSRDGTQLATAGGFGAFDLRVWEVAGLAADASKE